MVIQYMDGHILYILNILTVYIYWCVELVSGP